MNEAIKKFYPGQTVKLNLPKEPVKYEQRKQDGIMKSFPVTEPVDCQVKGVNQAEGWLDFVRADRPNVVFRLYTPTEKDVVVKDVPRAKGDETELPVIKRLKNGENVVLALPKEPVKWVKKDGKMVAETEDVPCVVHSVNQEAGTISFVRNGSDKVTHNFVVTDDNLVQDEVDEEPTEDDEDGEGTEAQGDDGEAAGDAPKAKGKKTPKAKGKK